MENRYEAPELTFVGKAEDVILGSPAVGIDIDAMMLIADMEFAEDE